MDTKNDSSTERYSHPHQFQVSEYRCSWLGSGRYDDDGQEIGGCVAVRIARTGNDDDDWIVSDEEAETLAQAIAKARDVIAMHEANEENAAIDAESLAATVAEERRCGRTRAEVIENIDQLNSGRETCGLAPAGRSAWMAAIDEVFSAESEVL